MSLTVNLNAKAVEPRPELCLKATEFLDYNHPDVQAYLSKHLNQGASKKENAVRLYSLVRDGWKYNPYIANTVREESKAGYIVTHKHGYCITKATLLAALCRAAGIPARLGFGDVKNHLATPRMIAFLKSEIFAWHGFTELYLDDRWIRCTPAFDAGLCRKLKVAPLDFDGETDSLFQPFDNAGRQFMEYTAYRGVHDDLPFEEIFKSLAEIYPHAF